MRIHVHLGVHKTATTFIQSQLANNKPMLARSGFVVAGIWVVRKRFTNLFDRLAWFDPFWWWLTRPYLKRRLDSLIGAAKPSDTFILSDENIIGLIAANFWMRRLYPGAARRTRILSSLLKEHDVHYFICIRRYADYLTSSWLQLAAKGRAPAFETYLSKFPPSTPGWSELVAGLSKQCGPEKLTVWTYDWFNEDPVRVFGLLAPGMVFAVPEEELRRDILPSLTLKGVEVIRQLESVLSKEEIKRMATLVRAFPFDEPNQRLEITDAALLAAYDRKYAADLENIRALGITLHA